MITIPHGRGTVKRPHFGDNGSSLEWKQRGEEGRSGQSWGASRSAPPDKEAVKGSVDHGHRRPRAAGSAARSLSPARVTCSLSVLSVFCQCFVRVLSVFCPGFIRVLFVTAYRQIYRAHPPTTIFGVENDSAGILVFCLPVPVQLFCDPESVASARHGMIRSVSEVRDRRAAV